ncbi:MAG TPA: nuclear transport factor 2 family protein [Thermoanaerobaculia bacterium]|nr:nuclear transport factor 2 family protein [Thermoanaerobaculia bacterium]
MITSDVATAWAERYFSAWKTNDAAEVESLFSENAVYFYGPFRPPARGREEIVRRWTQAAKQTNVQSEYELVAVDGDTAVIRWNVSFDQSGSHIILDGVLIVRFDERGLCREHREWYGERVIPVE